MTALDAMRMALEALHYCFGATDREESERLRVITNLRAAIAEMEQAEPTGYMKIHKDVGKIYRPYSMMDDNPLYLHPAAPSQESGGGCTLAGPGRGDCEHFIGLPGLSEPGQHDGDDDTVDAYGKPNGWCWSCWKSYRIAKLEDRVRELEAPTHEEDTSAHEEAEWIAELNRGYAKDLI